MLGYEGLARFVGKMVSQAVNGLGLAAFVSVQGYLLFHQPSLSARSINVAAALLLVFVQCAWLLLRGTTATLRPVTRGVGLVFLAYGLLCVFRIFGLVVCPDSTDDYFQTGTREAFFLIAVQMLFFLLTYCLGLMVNKRLLLTIRFQEEKYSKTFHSSPCAIILSRLSDGKILEVNKGFLKILGYCAEDVQCKTTFDLNLWARPEDRAAMVAALEEKGEGGGEFPFKRKSGEIITGLYSAVVIPINGEKCLLSTVIDITESRRAEKERERLIAERGKALSEVKTLSGLLPICAACKKIRDDKGYWHQIEAYVLLHSEAEFSHGICPECAQKYYPELPD
jgi:PAS domain S-box-containing protein